MRNLSKIKSILAGVLLVVPLAFAHYYIARPITNPISVVGTATLGTATTSTQWFCVNAAGAVSGGPWAAQALAEAPCGTAVAADGVTRYLEERVTTTRPTTQTTSTRRVELLGGTGVRVSDAQAGVITQSGPRYFPPATSGDITALYAGYTPTIYAAPADVGDGSGSSEANAQDFPTAIANATDGAIVGMVPGVYTHVASPAYRSNVPGWHPADSGTAGSPIIFVAKYPGAGLSTPLANANRTELRAGSGAYDGSDSHPVFGANGRSYIRWIGMVVDEDNAVTKLDNGPAYIASSTGIWIKYCVIRGSTDATFLADNHSAIRIGEGTTTDTGHVVTDNILYNFSVGYQTNAAGIITYGAQNSTVERNHIYDSTTGIYIKGTGNNLNTWNYGAFSANRIHDVDGGMRLEAVDPSNDLVVQHNLIYNFAQFGMTFAISAGAGNTRNIDVSRNSLVLTESSANGGPYLKAFTGTNVRFNDNIVAIYGTTNQAYMNAGEYSADTLTAFDYNGFYGSTAGTKWIYGATNATTIGQLEGAVTNSNGNQILGADPFVNQGTGDYTVTGGALTASSTGGPIGADYSLVGPQ